MALIFPAADEPVATRSIPRSLLRGLAGRCPHCGRGRLFERYLKVVDRCPECDEVFSHHRADDAPPYFTMFIVGHIVVGLMLAVEVRYTPALWIHAALWFPLTIVLALALLPRIKGAIVGLQWAARMHGFGDAGMHESL